MKSLQESLLDDEDIVIDNVTIKVLIKDWLKKYNIKNYKINKDNTIDVKGDVYLRQYPESELPSYIQFRNIVGVFSVYSSKLKTLRGCPKEVGVDFNCCDCKLLQTLEYAPEEVGRGFYCAGCDSLTSLEGCPKHVGKYFNCSRLPNLTSFEGAPETIESNMRCIGIPKVKSLKGFPKTIKGSLWIPEQFNEQEIRKISDVCGDVTRVKLNTP